jgi:hypothetical protein
MRAKMRVGCKFSLVEGQDSTVGVSDNELLAYIVQIHTFTRQPQISIHIGVMAGMALSTKNVVQNWSWALVGQG